MDSDLVSMVKCMMAKYIEYGGGHYQSKYPDTHNAKELQQESHLLEKVGGDLSILFKKPIEKNKYQQSNTK